MDHGAAKTNSAKTARGDGKANGYATASGATTTSDTAGSMDIGPHNTGSMKQRSARGSQQTAALPPPIQHGASAAPTAHRPKAPPPPPSSRRELPAPTPLVLPTRLQGSAAHGHTGQAAAPRGNWSGSSSGSNSSPSSASKNASVKKSQNAAKQTLAMKNAPPPPSSRRAQANLNQGNLNQARVSSTSAQSSAKNQAKTPASGSLGARQAHDPARHTDAQWAAHLEAPRDAARARSLDVPEEPPQLPDNLPLLNLEGEISALRPRPSELPPEPQGVGYASDAATHAAPVAAPHSDRLVPAYRGKTPSDLSVLYQALPTGHPERTAGLAGARSSNGARSRGYVPKAPHEFLPPPPPPNKRVASKSFTGEEDDEVPTQARRPAIYPYETQTPTPGVVLTPQAVRDSTPAPPLASMVVPSNNRGMSPIPPPTAMAGTTRLPPPPPLPTNLSPTNLRGVASSNTADWDDREWTDAKHLEAIQLGVVAPVPDTAPAFHTPVPPAADSPPHAHVDSVRPTALTVPAPVLGFPTFGLPVGWAPVAGASVLGAAISAGAFLLPDHGQLLVDVSNQSWTSLRDAQVYVNDELVCTQSPCAVKVDAAPQRVRVTAPGYQSSADDSVIVTEGSVTLHKIQLGASADTGIEVQTSIPNLQLYVDGRRIGSLPRKVMGLPPGEHTLLVSGGDNFTTEERRIQLEPNQTLLIDDLQPKLRSGTLELRAGDNSKGASVSLDGAQISLPFKGSLDPGRRYVLRAEREGFVPFEQTVEIASNNPVVEVELTLRPAAAAETAEVTAEAQEQVSRWSRNRWRWQAAQRAKDAADVATTTRADAPTPADEPAANDEGAVDNSALGAAMRQSVGLPASGKIEKQEAKASGSGSINIVTSPSAVILLDGKPVGKTPKRITVSAGTHSLVLIHANGRKRASINVEPGANKTIKASF